MKKHIISFVLIFLNISLFAQDRLTADTTTNTPPFSPIIKTKNIDDILYKSGGYFDFLVGMGNLINYSTMNTMVSHYNPLTPFIMGVNTKIGHKWYLREGGKALIGVEAIWARLGVGLNMPFSNGSFQNPYHLIVNAAPLNIGFASVLKNKQGTGMEANINLGFNMMATISYINPSSINDVKEEFTLLQPGIIFHPCLKFVNKTSCFLRN